MTAFILLLILAAILGGPVGIAWLLGFAVAAYLVFSIGVLIVCAFGEAQEFYLRLTGRSDQAGPPPAPPAL